MQEYLTKTRLGAVMDHMGSTAALFLISICFFVLLWGVRLSAILAGLATFALFLILRESTRKHRLQRREEALRRRIGGEMKMEQWLITQPRRAHFEAALLLSQMYNLEMERADEEGALCRLQKTGEQLLIACAQLHPQEKLSARDIAAFQRACLKEKAVRGVLCGAGTVTLEGREQAELTPRIALIGREKMIALAGAACPATDEQLVELGARRNRRRHHANLWQVAVDPERAQRYLFYGVMLCCLYFLLGSWFYLLPGCICLILMALCRAATGRKREDDTL